MSDLLLAPGYIVNFSSNNVTFDITLHWYCYFDVWSFIRAFTLYIYMQRFIHENHTGIKQCPMQQSNMFS